MQKQALGIQQHLIEMELNRSAWQGKATLRSVYQAFYSEIASCLDANVDGKVVELGSGLGNIKSAIPDCVTTDIFPNPWLDQVEDAYDLSFNDSSVGNLILFDVFHHLQYPGTALQEFRRVLAPGGRLIIFEPAAGLIGRIVFGLFHHEPLALDQPIEWNAPAGARSEAFGYYAAQGNATRIFRKGEHREKLRGWQHLESRHYSALSYLATGGFSGPQLYPDFLMGGLDQVDGWLSRFPSLASRMMVVLRKTDQE